jgi:hypothetical protein
MFRRHILSALPFFAALNLTGCAGTTTTTTPTQLATDVNLIASGLSSAIASISQIPGVSAAIVSQLQADLATIQADAAQVANATQPAIVQEIGTVVQAVATIALPLIPGGSAVAATVQAAVSLLPVVLATAGVSGAPVATQFTPEQARLILAAAH